MSNPSKAKGSRGELEFAKRIQGRKVPLSGAHPDLPGDVEDMGHILPKGCIWQVKRTKVTPKPGRPGPVERVITGIQAILEGHHGLAMRRDHEEWLVVMELRQLEEILAKRDKRIERLETLITELPMLPQPLTSNQGFSYLRSDEDDG